MNIEKLLFAILLSLLALLGISLIGLLIAVCVTYFLSIGQYSVIVAVIAILILFGYLVHYFYKNAE